jgi:hypothetical protein
MTTKQLRDQTQKCIQKAHINQFNSGIHNQIQQLSQVHHQHRPTTKSARKAKNTVINNKQHNSKTNTDLATAPTTKATTTTTPPPLPTRRATATATQTVALSAATT